MFGESESESPRVPSPWDSVISTPPNQENNALASANIPKLVPEAEEGNVEYKLQLLSPSEARFTRLVTQLKWRLLEGGGQAYYELGVADSGALVGLPRTELEQSLETLEMMAGEIGASVIVVKEIEVPAAMAGLAASETDSWNNKRRRNRAALLETPSESDRNSPTEADDTELSTTDATTTDLDDDLDLLAPPACGPVPYHLRSNPTSATNASPTIYPLDANMAVFSMDPEPDIDADAISIPPPQFTIDLEIASVFKLRPVRKRATSHVVGPTKHHRKRGFSPNRNKKTEGRHHHAQPTEQVRHDDGHDTSQTKQQAKFLSRRAARDRRREEKRKALLTCTGDGNCSSTERDMPAPYSTTDQAEKPRHADYSPLDKKASADLVSGLESLHVNVEPASVLIASTSPLSLPRSASPTSLFPSEDSVSVDASPTPTSEPALPRLSVVAAAKHHANSQLPASEPRLIVEALVVRKLSLEEAFLDFGGFSLM